MKTILITGSTDGIGKLTAEKLAIEGHQIIVHGRNAKKLEESVRSIKQSSGNKNIIAYQADLSAFKDVQKRSASLQKEFSTIDVLINNAGVLKSTLPSNDLGLDLRFAVNYFAPYLLTNAVLPLLKNSQSPRLINVSSAAQAPISLNALGGMENINQSNAYAQSKLALTMWSFYMAIEHPEINTIAVNPGSLLNTKMVQEAYGQHWSTADKGANILYELALSEKHNNCSGKYFDNDSGAYARAHDDAYIPEKISQLITQTHKILKNDK